MSRSWLHRSTIRDLIHDTQSKSRAKEIQDQLEKNDQNAFWLARLQRSFVCARGACLFVCTLLYALDEAIISVLFNIASITNHRITNICDSRIANRD